MSLLDLNCEMAVRSLLFSGRLDLDETLWQLDLDDTRVT